jgi:hypothetical protein
VRSQTTSVSSTSSIRPRRSSRLDRAADSHRCRTSTRIGYIMGAGDGACGNWAASDPARSRGLARRLRRFDAIVTGVRRTTSGRSCRQSAADSDYMQQGGTWWCSTTPDVRTLDARPVPAAPDVRVTVERPGRHPESSTAGHYSEQDHGRGFRAAGARVVLRYPVGPALRAAVRIARRGPSGNHAARYEGAYVHHVLDVPPVARKRAWRVHIFANFLSAGRRLHERGPAPILGTWRRLYAG